MKFNKILTSYMHENNLVNTNINSANSFDMFNVFLTEAKQKIEILYANMTLDKVNFTLSANDTSNRPFYSTGGKNIKKTTDPEILKNATKTQLSIYGDIFNSVKEKAAKNSNKLTLIEFFATSIEIHRNYELGAVTAGYNGRVLFNILKDAEVILPDKGSAIASASPAEITAATVPTSKVDNSKDLTSKFDTAVQDNEPAAEKDIQTSDDYFKVDRGTVIAKEEMQGSDRTLAAWLISIILNEIPGTYNKQSLTDSAREIDSEVSAGEIHSMINRLIKMGKIKTVPSSKQAGDDIYGKEDEESPLNHTIDDEPEDIVDRQLTGSTRKGFNFDAFDQ